MSENSRRDILEELRICRKMISAGEELTPRLLVYSKAIQLTADDLKVIQDLEAGLLPDLT
jgi:hypothetical protein